jgi:DNA-binding transcriptional MerR regulator
MSTSTMESKVGIGDAARIVGVPTHTLRYWEKEFGFFLNPDRTDGGQRRYDDSQLDKFEVIRRMLKDEGYSIAGARRQLSRGVLPTSPSEVEASLPRAELIRRLAQVLQREVIDAIYVEPSRISA